MRWWQKTLTARLTLAALALGGLHVMAARGLAAGDTPKNATPAIRVAPPAPVFPDAARVAELAERRARVAQEIGPGSVLVLFSAESRIYTNDVNYEFRQENNLYYLTHLKQGGANLVLMPGNAQTPEILFLPRRNPQFETWNGRMYAPEEAAQRSGVKEIWDAREFQPFINALRSGKPYRPAAENVLLSSVKSDAAAAHAPSLGYEKLLTAAAQNQAALYLLMPGRDEREYRREKEFAQTFSGDKSGGFTVKNAQGIFGEMRLRKSASELQRLQHAIDITGEGFGRAMAAAGRVKWEYEIEAEIEYTFKRRNADYWGYPSIVGCGPNATTLHYETSQGPVTPGALLLMDVGAEYDHYTADITRTFPVNGKFSKEQAEIYQIVYDAQEAVAKVAKPGVPFAVLQQTATQVVSDGLLRLGLITERSQSRIWFMHGLGHWLGMNVHDVGTYGKLAPGMVFTNEPGIYIREDALDYMPPNMEAAQWEKFKTAVRPAFEKYKNIGVRIEDDLVVTPDGVEWMTRNIPRSIPDIENTIARARQELTARHDATPWDTPITDVFSVNGAMAPRWAVWPATVGNVPSGQTARRGFVRVGMAQELAQHTH